MTFSCGLFHFHLCVHVGDDLVILFGQNLSPVLTKMTKEVDAREKELTHQVHREWLIRSLDSIKQLTPVLISGIKIYVTTKDTGKYMNTHVMAAMP